MKYNSSSSDGLYFIWPFINYFPTSSLQDKESIWREFENIMSWIVIPIISLVGIVGNMLNISILLRGKLKKSSTCLILVLALTDTLYLLGTNNVPIHLYARGEQFGFDYSEPQSEALFYMYVAQRTLEQCSKVASLVLPFLITLDRLVAVLLPCRYSAIVTLGRVRAAMCLLLTFSTFYAIFSSFKFTFQYVNELNHSSNSAHTQETGNFTYSGMIAKSDFFLAYGNVMLQVEHIIIILYGPIPLILTIIGCLEVGVKIRIQETKRKSLFANVKSSQNNKDKSKFLWRSLLYSFNKIITLNKIITSHTTPRGMHLTKAENLEYKEKQEKISDGRTEQSYCEKKSYMVIAICNVYDEHKNNKSMSGITHVSKSWKNKTTRTLLSVCSVYCVANTFNFIVVFFFDQTNLDVEMAVALETCRKFVLVLNSSCNFLFYVGLNRNFKESYGKLFGLCFCSRSKRVISDLH
ncbi:neuropeptides capa receptor [Biomphalaria pfeifferi]|uniref:Neuropeptides capa receptor n=1 Tax=Biomphalaria pfeifferi TaxID=112525 RepID=A0AAD8BHB0_BIOPF|nr:neuropeptides capa receptor [Biomphalaria pfeifferi]